ncbi:crooked neck protein [Aphelenchoides avenae]|nr:crooked neck protein [Aphelenchus avenae]
MIDQESTKKPIKLPKKAEKVKNKAPAGLQITAEQLLREAKERELEIVAAPPKVKITDPEELAEYQRKKRKEFEDNIRKNRMQIANWVKYAKWEESVGEIQRARSVFERALDVDHRSITLWLQYAEMEMRNRQINHARNIWDRAVTILPRATQFWLKYSYMEELVENIPGARVVFERWMEWEPNEQGWQTYINFELRYKEIDRARSIYQRFLHVHGHDYKNWIRYAKFEERHGYIGNSRAVYEHALEFYGQENLNQHLLIAFAQFEERQKEFERARIIYQYGLDNLKSDQTAEIFKCFTLHEKKYGERVRIENVIVSKRRHQYEQQVNENPYNYDAWFDYIRLLTNEGVERTEVEDVFERAIANIPPYMEKRFWRRYIWLWIYYAVYEELDVKDAEKTREIWKACLENVPHKKFTFAKLWIMFAQFEVRQLNLGAARKIMGAAIGKCPKKKLFSAYIDLELQLREFERCRKLYEKFIEFSPESSMTWIRFAELENLLGDEERARAIFDIATKRPALDMPEVLWKAYIDFEIQQEATDRVRRLYERLLEKTKHIKVWISWTEYEVSIADYEKARSIYQRANNALEGANPEERLLLLESWKEFEQKHGTAEQQEVVDKLMPRKVKKRRPIQSEDGTDAGWEEYFDYVFPQDQASKVNFKLLEAARRWREQNAAKQQDTVGVDHDVEDRDEDAGGGGEEYPSVSEQLQDDAAYRASKAAEAGGGEDSDTDLSESSSSGGEEDEEGGRGRAASDSDED